MIRALVLSHANVAHELLRAVELIVGPVTGIEALSNEDLSVPQLAALVADRLHILRLEQDPVVIFVDVQGGSCATAALMAVPEDDEVVVICGVNLPMLIGFATWRERTPFDDLIDRLVQRGRAAIMQAGAPA
jgi:PTS system mannose-specific IIA component